MKKLAYVLVALSLLGVCLYNPIAPPQQARANPSYAQSVDVAVVGSLAVYRGGRFPTATTGPTGSFTAFNFTELLLANVNAATLASYDTVLLNVSSTGTGRGLYCNVNTLSAQQKQDLVDFVAQGKKLIIYDSECPAQDYSWLPYPFTTANPGALGAHGTSTIVENNSLSSNVPADTTYINTTLLDNNTDAIGDMNVMTTYDPAWCLDMSGTNAIGVTGPVHTYARYGTPGSEGLIIYNGLDVDAMGSSTIPTSASGAGNIAKIWLQELQTPFNPSNLPCGVAVVGINISPLTASNPVGQSHTVTATLVNQLGTPQPGITVSFTVISGPNAGMAGAAVTDANGQCAFTYVGNGGPGIDQIRGCFTNAQGIVICSQTATKEWQANLCPNTYRWSTVAAPPYKWAPFPTMFQSWNQVRLVNPGPGDVFSVTATISCAPANVTVIDGMVSFGNIPAGGQVWSTDDFALATDMTNPQSPNKGICWTIDYLDAAGNHHQILNVAKFCGEECSNICP